MIFTALMSGNFVCAKQYKVIIDPMNSLSAPHKIIYDDTSDVNFASASFQLDASKLSNRSLDVGVIFEPGFAYFHFKLDGQPLSTSQQGWKYYIANFNQDSVAEEISIYIPHPLIVGEPETSIVMRPSNTFLTKLRISVSDILESPNHDKKKWKHTF
jgi:hypothetical protein